jgi:7-carboxy-7-deazaguanine synthase
MKVIEIFDSIDGEGIYTGALATFIRLAGCNLRCRYCDTTYSFTGGEEMTIGSIVAEVERIGNVHVTLTGGEPLIHKDVGELIKVLCQKGYIVNIETNGSVDVEPYQWARAVITMDYKTPSSRENSKMDIKRINTLRSQDVLKIVCNEEDFGNIKELLSEMTSKPQVFISPIFGEIDPQRLVSFAKELRTEHICNVRVQIQLHKIIWKPEERGV